MNCHRGRSGRETTAETDNKGEGRVSEAGDHRESVAFTEEV